MRVRETGYVSRAANGLYSPIVERYPSGRKLPAPRRLIDADSLTGQFQTLGAALDALREWKADPRSVKQVTRRAKR